MFLEDHLEPVEEQMLVDGDLAPSHQNVPDGVKLVLLDLGPTEGQQLLDE